MNWYHNLRMTAKIMLPIGAALVIALALLTWQIQSKSSTAITALAESELAAIAGKYGNESKATFEGALDESHALANALSLSLGDGTPMSRELVIRLLQGVETGNDAFVSAGIAWEPNAFDGNDAAYAGKAGYDPTGRFSVYTQGATLSVLEGLDGEYYAEPKKRNRVYMTEPYFFGEGNKKQLLATACSPVKIHNVFKGVVMLDLSLDKVVKDVSALQVYKTGFCTILTQDGTIVADKDLALVGRNQFDLGRVTMPDALRQSMRDGKPFVGNSMVSGRSHFFYYFPIHFELTGQTWYFVVAAPVDEVLAPATEISRMTLGISIATLLVALMVVFFVVRSGVKPVGVLVQIAQEVANGNLRVIIHDEQFGGEMRELAKSLKEMITSLLEHISKAEALSAEAHAHTAKAEEAMRQAEAARLAAEGAKREGMLTAAGQLEDVVNIISAASAELSAQIEQSERGSSEQAARVSETATAMEEMNSTVMEVARSASTASEMSGNARSKADSGAKIVQGAVVGIRNVQAVSLALKDDMSKLAEQAQSISTIMGVISDIADQTNLLALNAAIEAARAGDAGRGFAVVADEVRKLAEKTMTSTTDVGKAIQSIQQSVKESISQVERAVGLIDIATEQSNKSGEALGEIVVMVDHTADQVRAIAAAGEQQSATSEEINRSIGHINEIAVQTARAMRESSKAVSELAAQAQALGRLIDGMKRG